MRDKIQILKVSLLLSILGGYLFCVNHFTHMHVLNGVMVVHSHPYKSSPTEHSHTTAHLLVLQTLSEFQAIEAPKVAIPTRPETPVIAVIDPILKNSFQIKPITRNLLRAPPVV